MAGLFFLPSHLWRTAAACPYLPAPFCAGLCVVPAVRHLEAMAGELGRPTDQGRSWRHDRRYDCRPDGGCVDRADPLFLPPLMFSTDLLARAENLLTAARAGGVRIATAESCTGGLIAALLTEIPGSSDVFGRGFVTYSNKAKE